MSPRSGDVGRRFCRRLIDLSYYVVYVYVASLIEAGCLLPPGWCIGKLLPDLDILSAMFMSFYVCSWGGGSTNLWWVGGPSDVLLFLRVTSLCGITSFISFWGFGVPGELCPGAPFWVAL